MKTKGSKNKKGVSKIRNGGGYYEIYCPSHSVAKKNGYALEHRMVAYDGGMLLDLTMEVHHINGIKTDNRLENLEVLTKEKHTSITWKGIRRSDAGRPCRMCEVKTRSKYGLCRSHYKQQWAKNNIHENPELLK